VQVSIVMGIKQEGVRTAVLKVCWQVVGKCCADDVVVSQKHITITS